MIFLACVYFVRPLKEPGFFFHQKGTEGIRLMDRRVPKSLNLSLILVIPSF